MVENIDPVGKKDPVLDVAPTQVSEEKLKESFDQSVQRFVAYGIEFDDYAQEYLRRNPKVWSKVKTSVELRRNKQMLLEEEIKRINELDKIQSEAMTRRMKALSDSLLNVADSDARSNIEGELARLATSMSSSPFAQAIQDKNKQLQDILDNKDLLESANKLRPKGFVTLKGGANVSENDFNDMLNDSDMLKAKIDQLVSSGDIDSANELADMVGERLTPQAMQDPASQFEEQAKVTPVESPEAIGQGNPDDNIRKNIGAMLGGASGSGMVGASADKAQETVKALSNSLRSQRAKG